jgi:hypothetical protein
MQSKKFAISNVEKDSDKSMKMAGWEQASRDWKPIINKPKDAANNLPDM